MSYGTIAFQVLWLYAFCTRKQKSLENNQTNMAWAPILLDHYFEEMIEMKNCHVWIYFLEEGLKK